MPSTEMDIGFADELGSLDPQGFGPADFGSPTSTSFSPTKQQVEANYLSRCLELTRQFGAIPQGAFLESSISNELTSDTVTEDVQIANVIGSGSGFIFGLILHYSIRSFYRTGLYEIDISKTQPDANAIAKMQVDDIVIYLDGERLRYLIKQSGKSCIIGEIDDDGETTPFKQNDYEGLKAHISRLSPNTKEALPQRFKKPFLKLTAQRMHTYNGRVSTNPLYRNFKTLSSFGWQLGATISNFIGVEDHNKKRLFSYILSDVCCIVLGLFALPYWLVREKIFKIPPSSQHVYGLTGTEGWSKYTKTALTFGTAIGQAIGGIVAAAAHHATAAASSFSIAFWGGITGVISFVFALVGVPLVNWLTAKFSRNHKGYFASGSKDAYRNNYTRSGLTLGAGIGACLGLLIGNWVFGLILAATIFSALGSIVGGVVLSIYGHRINRYFHPEDKDVENSWDYVSRSTASVFGFIGAAVVCAINPAAALLLVPIGTAIASAIGWGIGLLIMNKARHLPGNGVEKKSVTLPWTQRITTGANIGSIIGGALGIAVGLAGFVLTGPASIILAVSVFGAIGAVAGGTWGALFDKEARKLIFQGIKSLFYREEEPKIQSSEVLRSASSTAELRTTPTPVSAPRSSDSSPCSFTARAKVALQRIRIEDAPLNPSNTSFKPLQTQAAKPRLMGQGHSIFSYKEEERQQPSSGTQLQRRATY